jgi:hypothetical protein
MTQRCDRYTQDVVDGACVPKCPSHQKRSDSNCVNRVCQDNDQCKHIKSLNDRIELLYTMMDSYRATPSPSLANPMSTTAMVETLARTAHIAFLHVDDYMQVLPTTAAPEYRTALGAFFNVYQAICDSTHDIMGHRMVHNYMKNIKETGSAEELLTVINARITNVTNLMHRAVMDMRAKSSPVETRPKLQLTWETEIETNARDTVKFFVRTLSTLSMEMGIGSVSPSAFQIIDQLNMAYSAMGGSTGVAFGWDVFAFVLVLFVIALIVSVVLCKMYMKKYK